MFTVDKQGNTIKGDRKYLTRMHQIFDADDWDIFHYRHGLDDFKFNILPNGVPVYYGMRAILDDSDLIDAILYPQNLTRIRDNDAPMV